MLLKLSVGKEQWNDKGKVLEEMTKDNPGRNPEFEWTVLRGLYKQKEKNGPRYRGGVYSQRTFISILWPNVLHGPKGNLFPQVRAGECPSLLLCPVNMSHSLDPISSMVQSHQSIVYLDTKVSASLLFL